MSKRNMKSALMVAGAAAGAAAAATWLGKKRTRHLSAVDTSRDELIEPESAELPVGRSADPEIDASLSRDLLPQDATSGGALLAEHVPEHRSDVDLSLDDIWSSTPGIAEPEQSEGYDAVIPEDMGAVWIERATQTTHEHRPHVSDPSDVPELADLISQSSLSAARGLDEENFDVDVDDNDDDEIGEDDLGDDVPGRSER